MVPFKPPKIEDMPDPWPPIFKAETICTDCGCIYTDWVRVRGILCARCCLCGHLEPLER